VRLEGIPRCLPRLAAGRGRSGRQVRVSEDCPAPWLLRERQVKLGRGSFQTERMRKPSTACWGHSAHGALQTPGTSWRADGPGMPPVVPHSCFQEAAVWSLTEQKHAQC
uniref:Uncharacterized protein n=1 Tax=Junco hyemalis TaxID=40217 RepID=A0A8C5JSF9_JUNHY